MIGPRYDIAAGTNVATAIQDMIRRWRPDVTFDFPATDRTTSRVVFTKHHPWRDAEDLAMSIGYELVLDASGACTLRPAPEKEWPVDGTT